MPDPHQDLVSRFVDMLQAEMRRGKKLEAALAEVEPHFDSPAQRTALAAAVARVRELIGKIERLGFPPTLRRPDRQSWYPGPLDTDHYWPALKRYLIEVKGWEHEVVESIDTSSNKVLSCLDFPGNLQFSTRGLVVGYVQSGKTANFTALISKAADAGFRAFIVLSGITNSLRRQTQERLDKELVALDSPQWMTWTDVNSDIGDFTFSTDSILSSSARHLAVVKKNGPRLRRLIRKLRESQPVVREQCPVLIIDDECDQASVNASGTADRQTVINRLVRELLNLLPRAAYIGYTATPYANVLIDPNYEEDLYPRDFIVALPVPPDYFGAERLFGRDLLEADEVPPADRGLNMIRTIPDAEVPQLRPSSRNDRAFALEITPSVSDAIRYYILATAAKCARGLGTDHSCMLVHTTVYAQPHINSKAVIEQYIAQLASLLNGGDSETLAGLKELWDREQAELPSELVGCESVPFSELAPYLYPTCKEVKVPVENSYSDDRLDFTRSACRYIVVGGNVLARGLTIEGLVVSYFVRTASQYDTLMQMGRWFGYRRGYEDLPRIWMTSEMADYFRDMATVEAEIRHDIAVYDREKVSPKAFAIRIRQHPDLDITAPNKMYSAVDCQVSFSGQHIQTRKFNRIDRALLSDNWNAAAQLISRVATRRRVIAETSNIIFEGVPFTEIISFIRSYKFNEAHRQFAGDRLVDYIRKQSESEPDTMSIWNVVVVGAANGPLSEEALGPVGRVRTVNRARLKVGYDADIKALMSRTDVLADLPGMDRPKGAGWDDLKAIRERHFAPGKRPVLLLYPINRKSEPTGPGDIRVALEAAADVLGVGMVFPKSDRDIPISYKRARIDTSLFEEVEYEEETLAGDDPAI